jgi:hypothetical protein
MGERWLSARTANSAALRGHRRTLPSEFEYFPLNQELDDLPQGRPTTKSPDCATLDPLELDPQELDPLELDPLGTRGRNRPALAPPYADE